MFNSFDYSHFDNNAFLKRLVWFFAAGAITSLFFILTITISANFALLFVIGIGITLFLGFLMTSFAAKFAYHNKLTKYFIISHDELDHKFEQMKKLANSSQLFSVPTVWTTKNEELQIAFTSLGGARCWFLTDNELPRITLDSKKNNFLGFSNLNPNGMPRKTMELEGDFPEHFDVYYEDNSQIIALQILSPDFMARLIDHNAEYDVEIYDNVVSLRSRRAQLSAEAMKNFLSDAEMLRDITLRTLNRVNNN